MKYRTKKNPINSFLFSHFFLIVEFTFKAEFCYIYISISFQTLFDFFLETLE